MLIDILTEQTKSYNISRIKYTTNDSNQIKKFKIISFSKIIGKHKKLANKIRELDDGSFISDGHNEIKQYNEDLKQKETVPLEKYHFFLPKKKK